MKSFLIQAARRSGGVPAMLAHHFKGDIRASVFSAALAVIAAKMGLLALLTKLSLLVVANLATGDGARVPVAGTGPVVLYLDEATWFDRYHEQSPLDRCLLAEDLGRMLARAPRTLTVDFDLSPARNDAAAACQAQLDTLLDRNAPRLVLLAPLKVSSPAQLALKRDWMLARCRAGVAFGDGSLDESLGVVIDARDDPNSLAHAARERDAATICADIATPAGVQKWLRKAGDGADETSPEHEDEPRPINFAAFARTAAALPMGDPALGRIGNWSGRDVFFGGDYGSSKDDAFLTPMGTLPGVAVHAARLASLDNPVDEPAHGLAFLIDLLIAFVFSLVIALFWRFYAIIETTASGFRRESSGLLMAGFVVSYAGIVYVLFTVAVDLFAKGILIAPLLIAASMLVDGFITGPVAAVLEETRTERAPYVANGSFLALLLVFGLSLVAAGLIGHAGTPVLAALAMAALVLDRLISSWWPADAAGPAGGGHAHGHAHAGAAALPAWWHGPAVIGSTVLLAYTAEVVFVPHFGSQLTTTTLALAASVAMLLVLGGVPELPRLLESRASRVAGVPPALARLGVLALPAGVIDFLCMALFALRQWIFWVVVIDALFLMMSHH